MSRSGSWGAGLSWSPQQIGRSLPIHRGLWISRGLAGAVTLLIGWWAFQEGRQAITPAVEPLAEAEAEQLVSQHLAKTQLPRWDPGPSLPKAERPARQSFSPPPLWRGGSIGDAPLEGHAFELASQGRQAFENGEFQSAATQFLEAAGLQPTWEARYNAGLSLLAAGDPEAAAKNLAKAEERLQTFSPSAGAAFPAAQVVTPYAAGLASLESDCLESIFRFRRAVRALDIYRKAKRAAYDRRLPFRVVEGGVDSATAWSALASAYDRCEGRSPRDYDRQQNFATEYPRADIQEVKEGPFAGSLADCVAAGGKDISSRCWAYSNLNKASWGSRIYFPQSDEANVGKGLDNALLPSLAQLAYEIAWQAAGTEKDREKAGTYLVYAARIDRKAEVEGFAEQIAELGKHIAPLAKDYSLLAEPWRRRNLAELTLEADLKPDALKGAAWALQEHWAASLHNENPKVMMDQIDAQVGRAGPYGTSLQDWKEDVQEKMRETLTAAMLTERDNGNLAEALAIRKLDAPWLGSSWSTQALGAWMTWKDWLLWTCLFLGSLIAILGVWLFHRLVIFPYLVYNADFYRLEHQRRHAERKRQGKAFTRDEIEPFDAT